MKNTTPKNTEFLISFSLLLRVSSSPPASKGSVVNPTLLGEFMLLNNWKAELIIFEIIGK